MDSWYSARAPKIGLVANSINVFSQQGKEEVEGQCKELIARLIGAGLISSDSIVYPDRICGPHEAQEVADLFTRAMVDGIVLVNSAFPNGNTFLTFAVHPYLAKVPLVVTAPPEAELAAPEWATNAWCGVIMNNYVAHKIDRHIFPLAGWPRDQTYQDELKALFTVFSTIGHMRRDFLGRFGDAPGGFHSASGDQLAYARVFGTRVETIDWTAVMETYRTGTAKGYMGDVHFEESAVRQTAEEMKADRLVLVEERSVERAARLYHALRAIIKAHGYTSAAFRCWPEMCEPYIGIAPCLSIGWLLSKGEVTAAACEGDWPTAVAQSIATLLSGKPGVCLDFVNHTPHGSVMQLGHCGVGIAGLMARPTVNMAQQSLGEQKAAILAGRQKVDDGIAEKSPERQVQQSVAPAHIGQFAYGEKTGINLVQDRDGRFKMLVFTGESRPDTARGVLYSASDVEVRNNAKLQELILTHGFSHHMVLAFGDISRKLRLLCSYYDIEYISAD